MTGIRDVGKNLQYRRKAIERFWFACLSSIVPEAPVLEMRLRDDKEMPTPLEEWFFTSFNLSICTYEWQLMPLLQEKFLGLTLIPTGDVNRLPS